MSTLVHKIYIFIHNRDIIEHRVQVHTNNSNTENKYNNLYNKENVIMKNRKDIYMTKHSAILLFPIVLFTPGTLSMSPPPGPGLHTGEIL